MHSSSRIAAVQKVTRQRQPRTSSCGASETLDDTMQHKKPVSPENLREQREEQTLPSTKTRSSTDSTTSEPKIALAALFTASGLPTPNTRLEQTSSTDYPSARSLTHRPSEQILVRHGISPTATRVSEVANNEKLIIGKCHDAPDMTAISKRLLKVLLSHWMAFPSEFNGENRSSTAEGNTNAKRVARLRSCNRPLALRPCRRPATATANQFERHGAKPSASESMKYWRLPHLKTSTRTLLQTILRCTLLPGGFDLRQKCEDIFFGVIVATRG